MFPAPPTNSFTPLEVRTKLERHRLCSLERAWVSIRSLLLKTIPIVENSLNSFSDSRAMKLLKRRRGLRP